MGRLRTLKSSMRRVSGVFGGFAAQTRGNVAMIFALVMPMLILMTVGGIDIHRASMVRANLQDALDAATLAAARSEKITAEDLTTVARAALAANMQVYPSVSLVEDSVTVELNQDGVLVANASANVTAIVADIFLPPYGLFQDRVIPVSVHSEVHRSTTDLEVSLVLDITGSMAGDRLKDLQDAANELVTLVVKDNQDVNTTRMALVPYSMGVNAGTYLDDVRGAARGPTNISGATWSNGNQKTISDISKANPGVFSVSSHGYEVGDIVWISGVEDDDGSGNDLASFLNDKRYRVRTKDNNSFTLDRWTGSAWARLDTGNRQDYDEGGKVQRCLIESCEVVVTTSGNHDLSTGHDVRLTSVNGLTQINTHNAVSRTQSSQPPLGRKVTRISDTRFSLDGITPAMTLGTYSSGGRVQCLEYGCANILFTNNNGSPRVFGATDCVTERVGDEAYTDAAPDDAPVAFAYTGTDNVAQGGCMGTTFTPLTTDRDTLKTRIDNFTAEGGTAGQIGVAWGWYMVSPEFAGVFPTASQPLPYGSEGLLKVVIIMTDGEFNAVHRDGIRAKDSGTGGGTNDRWINQNSDNGNPFKQSARLCDAMRAKGIIVYTVGFDINEQSDPTPNKGGVDTVDTAEDVMQYCATNPSYVYLPQNGSSLKTAFGAIGRSISQLRISR